MARRKPPATPDSPDLGHLAEQLRALAVPIASLSLDPANARLHPERNLNAIQASLRAYGQRKPLVVRRAGMIVTAGNGTLEAARALGWTHVAAVVVDDDALTATGYAIADNRTAELAEWDDEALARLLGELRLEEVDLDALGWSAAEVEALVAEAVSPGGAAPAEEAEEDPNPNDDLPDGESFPPPFPWFGGKRRVAGAVWAALGDVQHYVEPFAGSLAVLLGRPAEHHGRCATVNDLDVYVSNFWRASSKDPAAVAEHADNPVNESDLSARHLWLVNEGRARVERLASDPEYYDPQVAGWWVWGQCCWIGGGWCSGTGPHRRRPHLGDEGQGVNRQRPHLGTEGQGVKRQRPQLDEGRGVNRQRPHLGNEGRCAERRANLVGYMSALRDRLRDVLVCCGDWARVCTDGATAHGGTVGVFLDPPYLTDERAKGCYAQDGDNELPHAVRRRALELGADPRYRIVLAGYEAEHEAHMPSSWRRIRWRSKSCYQTAASAAAGPQTNRDQERLWLSPHCLA